MVRAWLLLHFNKHADVARGVYLVSDARLAGNLGGHRDICDAARCGNGCQQISAFLGRLLIHLRAILLIFGSLFAGRFGDHWCIDIIGCGDGYAGSNGGIAKFCVLCKAGGCGKYEDCGQG